MEDSLQIGKNVTFGITKKAHQSTVIVGAEVDNHRIAIENILNTPPTNSIVIIDDANKTLYKATAKILKEKKGFHIIEPILTDSYMNVFPHNMDRPMALDLAKVLLADSTETEFDKKYHIERITILATVMYAITHYDTIFPLRGSNVYSCDASIKDLVNILHLAEINEDRESKFFELLNHILHTGWYVMNGCVLFTEPEEGEYATFEPVYDENLIALYDSCKAIVSNKDFNSIIASICITLPRYDFVSHRDFHPNNIVSTSNIVEEKTATFMTVTDTESAFIAKVFLKKIVEKRKIEDDSNRTRVVINTDAFFTTNINDYLDFVRIANMTFVLSGSSSFKNVILAPENKVMFNKLMNYIDESDKRINNGEQALLLTNNSFNTAEIIDDKFVIELN